MTDKLKKKPSFFTLKRWNSHKAKDEFSDTLHTSTPTSVTRQPSFRTNPSSTEAKIPNAYSSESKPRKLSAGGIKELVQCALCLEVLHNPKMLTCQHTFCMACLTVYIADQNAIRCPICRTEIQVTPNFTNNLPSNLYIDYLLQLVGINDDIKPTPTPPVTPLVESTSGQSVDLFAAGIRCTQCQTICDYVDVTSCQHCKLNFCRVCWSQHLDDMRTQIGSILMQLDSAANRLQHKIEHYKDRCEHIVQQINAAAEEKINAIKEAKINILFETSELTKSGDLSALALKTSLEEAKAFATQAMNLNEANDKDRVTTFINLHQNALQILSDVSKWDSERFIFDKENFKIEKDASTPLEAESDEPWPDAAKQNNPLENEESLIMYYRSRTFTPHYMWRKTSRPSGVGISPWTNHLYICGMDSHSVLVVERTQAKIVTRLACEEMLCPVHIAFMKSLGEIYVTDKWRHCVHVFSKENQYVRSLGQKGSRIGMFRSPEGIATDNANLHIYVVDTGNDRVQILQPDGKVVDQIGVYAKQQVITTSVWDVKDAVCTELNAPTSVAITNDRVIILDSGNRRVKVYNKHDKNKITEFGAFGQRKGQFRQPEVLAVDPMGLILVGDSGNCRVQVFKQNGQLVRVFGGLGSEPGKFGWISGIHVSKQLDIIISDSKNHNVNFY